MKVMPINFIWSEIYVRKSKITNHTLEQHGYSKIRTTFHGRNVVRTNIARINVVRTNVVGTNVVGTNVVRLNIRLT